MDESKQSSEAMKEEADKSRVEEVGGEHEEAEDEELDEDDDGDGADDEGAVCGEPRSQLSEFPSIEAPFGGSQSETLAAASSSLQSSDNDLPSDFASCSHLLSEVPVNYDLLRPLESAQVKAQVGVSHQQLLVSVTTEAAQAQSENQLQSPGCPNLLSEPSPLSVTQSITSTSQALLDHNLSPVVKTLSTTMPQVEQQKSSNPKIPSAITVPKSSRADGFNWRKYGQKQVKSPQGSRSYYKCTYSDCHAKKIECSDHSNHVIEIISKGQHNHDPPRRTNCTRESRVALPAAPNINKLNDSDPSTSSRELLHETSALPETKRQYSSGSDETVEVDIKEEHVDEPEPKRRLKKSDPGNSGCPFKPGKKPKLVVHAAGDVGISGDGYRWRKYGQKMVKGNPHPRNYYRCTSAGCPVRKHIERAVDNSSALVITYKGVHDHDKPVPKKRQGPPSAPLVAAAAPASMNNLQFSKKNEAVPNQISATQWSVDTEGELTGEALDAGEEKAMESARTLLSIGFEIKQC